LPASSARPFGPSSPHCGSHVFTVLRLRTSIASVRSLSSRFVKNVPRALSTAYPSGSPSKATFAFAVSAPGFDASRIRIDLSRGVVTQTSLVAATYATPSGIESSVRHAPFTSETAPMPHTLESPRLPTKTTPSPTLAELGPTVRLRPPRSTSVVGKPVTGVTESVLASMTATLPVLPAGIQTR